MTKLAGFVSIALHPFVMITVLVTTAVAPRQSPREALGTVIAVVALTIVPMAMLMRRQVRGGGWQNADASNRAERPILFGAGIAAVTALLVYITLVRPGSFLIRGIVSTLMMLIVCAVATWRVKVSLHLAFAAFVVSALSLVRSPVGYALAPAIPALAWSRLVLTRHTWPEIALGAAIGAAAGTFVHYP